MTALGSMAGSVANSVAPATATQGGLGKWFAAASAIQALAQVGQGFSQNTASGAEADALNQQADLALLEGRQDAERQAAGVREFAGEQAEAYLGSGVTLEGSPALILADTRKKGQQEVDAIKRRAEYTSQALRTNAMRTKSAGRSSLLGAFTGAALGGLQNYIQAKSVFSPASATKTGGASPLDPVFDINPAMLPRT